MKQDFQQSKLGEREDPDEWINKLEILRRRLAELGAKIEDNDLILHILNNLTNNYASTVEI